jgi:RimJ/RimL family protein N-acetyltransferase
VVADCSAQNTASILTLEKLGFVHERTTRERLYWRRARRA